MSFAKRLLLCSEKLDPFGQVRVLWLCLEIQHGSIGVLDDWSIGIKTEDYDVFLFCF